MVPEMPGIFRIEVIRTGEGKKGEKKNKEKKMPATTLEINKVHCQPFRQPLFETCPSVECTMQLRIFQTNKQTGYANTNVLPMGKI